MAPAFPSLDLLPWLSVAQVEQVGVAPTHLLLQLAGYLVAGKLAQLLGDDELKGQVKQEVADFSPDLTGLSFAECVIQESLRLRPMLESDMLRSVPSGSNGLVASPVSLHVIPEKLTSTFKLTAL